MPEHGKLPVPAELSARERLGHSTLQQHSSRAPPAVQVPEKGCARAVSLHCFLPCSLMSDRQQIGQDGPTHRAEPVGTTSLPITVAVDGRSRWTVMLPSIPILCPFATSFLHHPLSVWGRPVNHQCGAVSCALLLAPGGLQRLHRAWVAPGAGTPRLAAVSASRRGAGPTAGQGAGS